MKSSVLPTTFDVYYTDLFRQLVKKNEKKKTSVFVTHPFSSFTAGVVYCLSCKRGNQIYIRKKERLTDHSTEYLYTINTKDCSFLVANHF